MIWLQPWALLGLLAVAGPIVVHLLRRQQSRRLVVPSTRFVRPMAQAAVRLRRPSDLLLLVIRVAIVAAAALALAAPLVLGGGRVEEWNRRIVRGVVVDDSASVRDLALDEVADQEVSDAYAGRTFRSANIAIGVERAIAWLAGAPPARRELVILSDFQLGSLTAADLARVPPGTGVRLVRRGSSPRPQELHAGEALTATGLNTVTAILDGPRTGARFEGAGPGRWDGVLLEGADAETSGLLRRAVSRAGAWAPSPGSPVILRFEGSAGSADVPPLDPDAIERLSSVLRVPALAGQPVGIDARDGAPRLSFASAPESLLAATALHAALDAGHDRGALEEGETEPIADSTLAALEREPAPVDGSLAKQADRTDARYLWAAVLVLLGIETFLRRRARADREEVPRAA